MSPVQMDFELLPSALSDVADTNLAEVDWFDLDYYLLEMPVLLKLGDVPVLNGEYLPIISIARAGPVNLKKLTPGEQIMMSLPGGNPLIMKLVGSNVAMQVMGRSAVGVAPIKEVLDVWEQFSRRVRLLLLQHHPELLERQDMGDWFREVS